MSSYDEDYSLLNKSKQNENEYKLVVTKRMIIFGLVDSRDYFVSYCNNIDFNYIKK